MNKGLKITTSAALLAGVVAPVAVSAATDSRVDTVPTIADDATSVSTGVITLKENTSYKNDLKNSGSFTLTFPSGAKIKNTTDDLVYISLNEGAPVSITDPSVGGTVEIIGDYTVNVTLPSSGLTDNGTRDAVEIRPTVTIDGIDGNTVDVKVEDFGAGVKAGSYTVANVAKGATTTTVLSTKTIGETGGQLGAIRIEENSAASLTSGDEIVIKLPKGFKWDQTATNASISRLGGLSGVTYSTTYVTDEKLELTITSNGSTSQRGAIQLTPAVTVDTDDAKTGDIEVDVYGDATDATVKVGAYSDYAVSVKADGDAKELVSGRYDSADQTAEKLQKLVIKETVDNSFINRKTTVALPTGVKIVGVKIDGTNSSLTTAQEGTYLYNDTNNRLELNGAGATLPTGFSVDENELEFTAPDATGKTEVELEFYVSVEADFEGDIVAEVTGGGVEGEALLGTAVKALNVTAESKNVQVGVRDQAIGDITLTEVKAESLRNNDWVTLTLEDTSWSEEPTVEVVDGDLEIDEDTIDVTGRTLTFQVKGESAKPSQIKISNAKVDLDRTVPEGDLKVEVSGTFITNEGTTEKQVQFEQDDLGKFAIAKVVTPAPGKVTVEEVKFTLGSTTYTVGGVEKTMDVAPYVEAGRTFMPIRYVAESVGSDFIVWDQESQTATIMKGDRVVQLTAGSKSLKVNGASIAMDAAATVKDGRTVLPVRFVGQAMGAQVDWNEADQTVTVK